MHAKFSSLVECHAEISVRPPDFLLGMGHNFPTPTPSSEENRGVQILYICRFMPVLH